MSKVKFIKDNALDTLRANKELIYKEMKETGNRGWIEKYLGSDYLGASKVRFEEEKIKFTLDDDNPISTDCANAIMLHETLKHMNETQASDERLWVGLSLTVGYDYLIQRWGLKEFTKFQYRWIYFTQGRRGNYYHGLARLWWFARLSYDASRKDPYELTKFAYDNPEVLKNMTYRGYSNSPKIRKAILNGLKQFVDNGGIIKNKMIDKLYKKVSLLGSVSLLDAYDEKDLTEQVYLLMFDILEV